MHSFISLFADMSKVDCLTMMKILAQMMRDGLQVNRESY